MILLQPCSYLHRFSFYLEKRHHFGPISDVIYAALHSGVQAALFTLRYIAGVTYFAECWFIHLLCTILTTPLLWRSLPFSHVFIYYIFSSYYVTVFSPCGFLPFSRPLVWVLLFSRCVFGFLCILVLFFIWISFRAYVHWFECVQICSALFSIIWCSRADFTTRLLLIRRRRIRSSWAIAHR